jgi:glycosyltransferase involved in cell wall biosynthesis
MGLYWQSELFHLSSPMKLLIISRCPPYPLHFGDRLILWYLAKELKKAGHTLDLLALAQFESDWQTLEQYQVFFRQIELFQEKKRRPLDFVKRLLFHYPKTASQAWHPELWQAIEKRLSEENYDAIQLLGGIQVYEYAHLLRDKPTVITPYESYSLYLKRLIQERGGSRFPISRFITRRFESFMFSPFGRTIVLTEEDKAELLGINPRLNIEVIPNGIDLDYFDARQEQRQEATLLFVGNYEYFPNVDAALILANQILAEVRRKIPNARLQVVGNAPPPDILALASESIEVTGRVPDIRPYYAQASVFVSPLRIGAGIKNKLLEAMAMRLPIVASPLSIEGIAGKDGEDFLVSEIDTMAETVVKLLQNKELQARLSAKSRMLIEDRYNWQMVAEAYSKLYQRL